MKTMGKYCKAYPIEQLRQFGGWKINTANLQKEKKQVDGAEVEAPRELAADDFLYLQENFTVTDGIFLDENVVFDNVTDEWKEFCTNTLGFEVPDFEPEPVAAAAQASGSAAAPPAGAPPEESSVSIYGKDG